MQPWRNLPNSPPDSNKQASGKPGAVQLPVDAWAYDEALTVHLQRRVDVAERLKDRYV